MKSENIRKEEKEQNLAMNDLADDHVKKEKETRFQFKVVSRRKDGHQFVHGE